jgi:hypothetical protein
MTAGTYEGYYSGTVEITLLGQTYQVVWPIESAKPGPQIMNGIGLLKRNILAVSLWRGASRSAQRITSVVSYEINASRIFSRFSQMTEFSAFVFDLCMIFKRNFLLIISTPSTRAIRSTNAFAKDLDPCDPRLQVEERTDFLSKPVHVMQGLGNKILFGIRPVHELPMSTLPNAF